MANPTRFSVETTPPSCYVTKALLVQLEDYLIKRLAEVTQESQAKIRDRYKVTICSKSGIEEVDSIEDHEEDIFADDVESISLYYHTLTNPRECRVSIKFYPSVTSSKFEMTLHCTNSKEHVLDTRLKVFDMLNKHKTWNSWLHPTLGLVVGVIVALGQIPLILYTVNLHWPITIETSVFTWFTGAFLTLSLGYMFLFPNLKPYSTFDTKRNQAIGNRLNWLIWAIIGAACVSGPIGLLWKKLSQ